MTDTDVNTPAGTSSMDVLTPPQNGTRRRLIARAVPPQWDWYAIRREIVQVVFVTYLILVQVVAVWALLRDNPKVAMPAPVVVGDDVSRGYARQVATLFASYDEATATDRAKLVAALVPGAPPAFGWDGRGKSVVTDSWILADTPEPGRRVISVAVVANGVTRSVVVRVTRDPQGRPGLVGSPTFGVAQTPAAATADPTVGTGSSPDLEATKTATTVIRGFLSAWGQGLPSAVDYAADGFQVPAGPGGLELASDPRFTVPAGGATRDVLVVVRWRVPGTTVTYPSAYTITLIRGAQRWSIQSFAEAVGAPLTILSI